MRATNLPAARRDWRETLKRGVGDAGNGRDTLAPRSRRKLCDHGPVAFVEQQLMVGPRLFRGDLIRRRQLLD